MDNLEEIKKQIIELQSKVDKIENQKKEEKKGKRWRAKTDNEYFYVDDLGNVERTPEFNDNEDNYRFKIRNYFKTKEEAEEYQDIINTYYDLMDLAEELNNGRKIDWNNPYQEKYSIYYNGVDETLSIDCFETVKDLGQIYCLDGDFLEKAIEKIGKDKLIKLFTYERS